MVHTPPQSLEIFFSVLHSTMRTSDNLSSLTPFKTPDHVTYFIPEMNKKGTDNLFLSYDVASGSEIMPCNNSDFIWPFLRPYMGVIPNPKVAFIFPISCILALIFQILIKYFPKCVGKGSFPKSQIKSLNKIDIPLVVYRLSGNFMTSITTLRT